MEIKREFLSFTPLRRWYLVLLAEMMKNDELELNWKVHKS
jgi:hypothetical protein